MYNNDWMPDDKVRYYLEEVCGFCNGVGTITGLNGQTVTCPVCNGVQASGSDDTNVDYIDYIVIDNVGVWYHMREGDIVSQARLIEKVEDIIPVPAPPSGGEEEGEES